jgi:hypothetical protein
MSPIGHLLPFEDSGEQPSERPLYFETCRKVNSHFSASAVVGPTYGSVGNVTHTSRSDRRGSTGSY